MKRLFLSIFVALTLLSHVFSQSGMNAQWRYIEKYKDMAVDQMHRYQVPASITLAQGLCESAAGQSRLVREANNHFGIKVGTGWTGPYIVMADDRPNDRFRKYKNDAESYEDHSRFLRNNQRYASLFELKITDYKGWAHGLKKCGYATNPKYASMLIDMIEQYNLTQFDYSSSKKKNQANPESVFYTEHIVYKVNKRYMIIANSADTSERIAQETGVSVRKLRKYNEWPRDYQVQAGDIVYLEKKRTKGDRSLRNTPHSVQPGESMHDIAQRYGIRLKNLYRLNGLSSDYVPQVGNLIWLR